MSWYGHVFCKNHVLVWTSQFQKHSVQNKILWWEEALWQMNKYFMTDISQIMEHLRIFLKTYRQSLMSERVMVLHFQYIFKNYPPKETHIIITFLKPRPPQSISLANLCWGRYWGLPMWSFSWTNIPAAPSYPLCGREALEQCTKAFQESLSWAHSLAPQNPPHPPPDVPFEDRRRWNNYQKLSKKGLY